MKEHLVYWSSLAEETYLNILQFIIQKWSVKEAEEFDQKVENLISKLKHHKDLCPPSKSHRKLRKCVITYQTSLIYQFHNNSIEIITFIDNRSNQDY